MIELSMISPIIHHRIPLILDIDHFVRLTTRLALPVQLLKVEFGHPKDAPGTAPSELRTEIWCPLVVINFKAWIENRPTLSDAGQL